MTSPKANARLVITGAGGAVGHALVPMALEAGFDVIAVDLPGVDIPCPDRVEVRSGDLRRRRFCKDAVAGGDLIIHAAAQGPGSALYEEMIGINVDAVRWLYQAASDAGAQRFVMLSSADLYKPRRGVLLEDSQIEPGSAYTATKAEAERFLRSQPEEGLSWTILRPSLSYGPRCHAFNTGLLTVPPLLRMFFSYVPGLTGGARNNWVHVEDIASAALLVATHPEASGQLYNVADQTPLAYGEILVALIQAYGLQMGPTIPFPVSIVQALSPFIDSDMTFRFLSGFLSPMWKRVQERHKLTGPLEPNVYRAGLAYLQGDRVVVTDKLTALGWQPRWPDLRQGMAQTVRWYQQARWVPDYRALPDEDILDEGIGLSYRERLDAQNGHLELTVTFPSLRRLALDQDAILEGTISLDGIATEAELVGTLRVHKARRDMVYEFAFTGDDGQAHRFEGVKHLTLLGLVSDFAHLRGTLVGSHGQQIADLVWRMDPREELASFVQGLKPSFGQ